MAISTILSFKLKIEDALSMVPDMIAEEKLWAVQFWNIVSEKLQEIVNNSADDITAYAFQLEKDKLPEFLDGSLTTLGASAGIIPGFNGCGGMTNQLITNSTGAYISPSIMKKYVACSETRTHTLPAPVLGIQRPRTKVYDGRVSGPPLVPATSTHTTAMVLSSPPKRSILPLSSDSHLPLSLGLRVKGVSEEETTGERGESDVLQRESTNDGYGVGMKENLDKQNLIPVENVAIQIQEAKKKGLNCPEESMDQFWIDSSTNDSGSSLVTCSEVSSDVSLEKGEKDKNDDDSCSNVVHIEDSLQNDLKPYNCFDCKSSFSSKGNLIVHRRRHTGEKPYVCAQCEARFSTKGNLRRHVKAHTGVKPWECTTCGGRFTEKKSLKVHMRRHTGERPYQCKLCSKNFSQSGILQSHMAMHLNQKAHLCELCGKSFRQKSQLRLHMQRHQGVRKFDCPHCPAKFLTKGDMQRHRRTHTGERPFECSLCGKTFTRQQSLNEHMNRHYGLKPYKCKYCRKGFAEMSACYKHIKSHEKSKGSAVIKGDQSENISDDQPTDPLPKMKESTVDEAQEEVLCQEIPNQENGEN